MPVTPVQAIGGTFSIANAEPATLDVTGFEALSYIEVVGVESIPEIGDDSEAGTATVLKDGRTVHYNSGNIVPPFSLSYIFDGSDPGQAIVRTVANTATAVAVRIEDTDGSVKYLKAAIGNLRDTARTVGAYKGETFEVRSQSGWTKVAA